MAWPINWSALSTRLYLTLTNFFAFDEPIFFATINNKLQKALNNEVAWKHVGGVVSSAYKKMTALVLLGSSSSFNKNVLHMSASTRSKHFSNNLMVLVNDSFVPDCA